MRHEQIQLRDSYRKIEVEALRPARTRDVPPATTSRKAPAGTACYIPTPAAPDVPAVAGKLIIFSYVSLLGAFTVATVASAYSIFMIAICGVFLVAFFTVPWLFLRQQPNGDANPGMSQFMEEGMDTLTGRIGGGAALVQMMIVPVFLTLGVLLMAVVIAVTL